MKKIIVLFLSFCFFLSPTHTSATTGLSVSPPVTEILLAPNKSVTTTIQLNSTGEETSYSLSLHKLIPTDDFGHSTIDPSPIDPTSMPLVISLIGAEWNEPYYISPDKPNNITLRLEASSLDAPVDVYLALLARPISATSLNPNSTTTPGITALILATITPLSAIPTEISLSDLSISPIHDNALPLTLNPKVSNKSSVMLRVKGNIELRNPWDKTIQTRSLEPALILGGTTRQLNPTTFKLKPSYLGPHTITVTITTEGGRELVRNSTVIWLFPIKAIILTLVSMLIITIFILRKYRLTTRQQ